jgi:hypothetical protein
VRRVRQHFKARGALKPQTHLCGRKTLLTGQRKPDDFSVAVHQLVMFVGRKPRSKRVLNSANSCPALSPAGMPRNCSKLDFRGLNRADRAGKNFHEISDMALHIAQVVVSHTAFGEMLEVFGINSLKHQSPWLVTLRLGVAITTPGDFF